MILSEWLLLYSLLHYQYFIAVQCRLGWLYKCLLLLSDVSDKNNSDSDYWTKQTALKTTEQPTHSPVLWGARALLPLRWRSLGLKSPAPTKAKCRRHKHKTANFILTVTRWPSARSEVKLRCQLQPGNATCCFVVLFFVSAPHSSPI